MPIYMMQGSHTNEGKLQFMQHPEERGSATQQLVKALGGTILGFYYCIGVDDFVLIVDLPDDETAMTGLLAGSAAGHIKNYKSSKLFTLEQTKAFLTRAGKIITGPS